MSQMKGYLDIKFNKNGAIEGSPRVKKIGSLGVEKMIEFWAFTTKISTPADKASGHLVGRRIHEGIQISYEVRNAGAVLLLNALCTNDKFAEGTFHFFDTNEKGESYEVYTLKITDGAVIAVETHLPNVHERHTEKEMPFYHTATFSYAKIEGTNFAKKAFTDDWSNQS